MNKELQDLVWSILPKEFKEEVKKIWEHENKELVPIDAVTALNGLFGIHNLTSDAEGEEMLTCEKSKVRYRLQYAKDGVEENPDYYNGYAQAIYDLFGSKCLPDKGTDCTPVDSLDSNVESLDSNVESLESKPAEPKFCKGDVVIYKRTGKKKVVLGMDKYGRYHVALPNMQSPMYVDESDLEPYTEPTANYLRSEGALNTAVLTGKCSSASTCDKQFDNIIKDGFKNHNRLHIAAMAMAGLLANEGVSCFTDVQDLEHMDFITYHAFEYADKLIKKSEEENDI